jgi:hypothetical protein
MKKVIVTILTVFALSVPVAAFADNGQLIALYQQLIQILKQEVAILQNQALTIAPASGPAPLTATFTVTKPLGNESIDFGDGRSTGSSGCTKNSQGFCDLSKSVTHTYQFPGNYTVTLYRGADPSAKVITTQTVTVK